jgi:hypothetical protein
MERLMSILLPILAVTFVTSFSNFSLAAPCTVGQPPYRGVAQMTPYKEAQNIAADHATHNAGVTTSYLIQSMMENKGKIILQEIKRGRITGDVEHLKGTRLYDFLKNKPDIEESQALVRYLLRASQMVGNDQSHVDAVLLYVEGKLAKKESLTRLSDCDTDDPLYQGFKAQKVKFPGGTKLQCCPSGVGPERCGIICPVSCHLGCYPKTMGL